MQLTRKFMHGKIFEKQWQSIGLNDDDLKELQLILLDNPKFGAVMQDTGRLRKMRFGYGSRGKSHCARVCYVDFEIKGIIVFIMVFAKNDMENLNVTEKKDIKKMIDELEKNINR